MYTLRLFVFFVAVRIYFWNQNSKIKKSVFVFSYYLKNDNDDDDIVELTM